VADKKNEVVCAACFLPYYYGFARKESNLSFVYQKLCTKGGIASCEDIGQVGYQWGFPNVWAPHQYFAYKALRGYGLETEAEELRGNYTRLLSTVYEKTGALWERYDENGAAPELEYPTQKMLGWTAGVYNYFYAQEKNKKSE
jgi:alpha,alpha-trehalase